MFATLKQSYEFHDYTKITKTRKIGLITKTTGIDQIFGYDPISATNEIKFSE